MPPLPRRLAAATVLCAIFAPWAAVIGTAVHLAADHHQAEADHHDADARHHDTETPTHDADAHDHFEGGVLHGHRHSADTPEHEHGLSLTGGVDRGVRPPVIGVTLTPWAHFAVASTSRGFVPAPAVSPPRIAPIVLRT